MDGKIAFYFLILLIIIFGIFDVFKTATDPRNTLITETRPLIEDCKKLGDTPFTIQGDYLIYDATIDKFVASNKSAFNSDKKYTIFIIYDKTDKEKAKYDDIYHTAAIQRELHIATVYWPEKKAVSAHSIMGAEPPSEKYVCRGCHTPDNPDPKDIRSSEYTPWNVGSVLGPLNKWIDSIPKS